MGKQGGLRGVCICGLHVGCILAALDKISISIRPYGHSLVKYQIWWFVMHVCLTKQDCQSVHVYVNVCSCLSYVRFQASLDI